MIVGYRWCRKNQRDYDVTLIGDILKSICAEKRRYMNREVNRKKREAGIPIHFGRPKKEKERPRARKSKIPLQPPGALSPGKKDQGRIQKSTHRMHKS